MPTAATFRDLCLALRDHGSQTGHRMVHESFGRAISGYRCRGCDWVVSYTGPCEIDREVNGACTFEWLSRHVRERARVIAWLEGQPLYTEYWQLCRDLAYHRCPNDPGFDLTIGGDRFVGSFRCRGCGMVASIPLDEMPPPESPLAPPYNILANNADAVKTASWGPWLRGEEVSAFDIDQFREEFRSVRIRRAPYTNDPQGYADPDMINMIVPPWLCVSGARQMSLAEQLRMKMAQAEDVCRDLYAFAAYHGFDLGARPRFELQEDRGDVVSRYGRGVDPSV
jgi:hypothetical protein